MIKMDSQNSNTVSTATNTPQSKGTMTFNGYSMQKSNPYAVGELKYAENISRPEIKKLGPILLKEQKHFCKADCSGASPGSIQFTLRCLTDLIRFQKYLKLNVSQKKKLKYILQPYKQQVLNLTTPKKHRNLVKKLYTQQGSGIFTGILAAVIPLISSLITRFLGTSKKRIKK